MAKFNIVVTGNVGCGKTAAYDIIIDQLSKLTNYSVTTFSYDACITKLNSEPLFKQLMNTIFKTSKMSDVYDISCNDSAKSSQLMGIIHPLINPQILRVTEDVQTDVAVLELPTWFEHRLSEHFICHSLVVVTADEDAQIERLQERDGLSRNRCIELMNRQHAQAIKIDAADYVVSNMYSLDVLCEQLVWYINHLEYPNSY